MKVTNAATGCELGANWKGDTEIWLGSGSLFGHLWRRSDLTRNAAKEIFS
jgi:hypothetical protein